MSPPDGGGGLVSATPNARRHDKNRILQARHVRQKAYLPSGAAFQCRRESATPHVEAQSVHVDVVSARLCGGNEIFLLSGFHRGRELNED